MTSLYCSGYHCICCSIQAVQQWSNQQRKSIIVHQRRQQCWRAQTKATAAAGFTNTQRLQAGEHNVFNKVPSMHLAILEVNVKNVNEIRWTVQWTLKCHYCISKLPLHPFIVSLWYCIAFNCIVNYCKINFINIRMSGKFYITVIKCMLILENQTKLVMYWATQSIIASIG